MTKYDILDVLTNPLLGLATFLLAAAGFPLSALFFGGILAGSIAYDVARCFWYAREITRKCDEINKRFGR